MICERMPFVKPIGEVRPNSPASMPRITGGAVFGYRNCAVMGPDGQRSHVEREIDEAQAAVVRRIF